MERARFQFESLPEHPRERVATPIRERRGQGFVRARRIINFEAMKLDGYADQAVASRFLHSDNVRLTIHDELCRCLRGQMDVQGLADHHVQVAKEERATNVRVSHVGQMHIVRRT